MVQRREVEGRIYIFKSQSECTELEFHISVVPEGVRRHMVLVLGTVPGKKNHFKSMAITSTSHDDGEHIPISLTPKKGYPIQLRLENHILSSNGTLRRQYPSLGPTSFLKIDHFYEVPIRMLREATDNSGNAYRILPKHQGGVAQLRHHVQQRDAARATMNRTYPALEKEGSEEANEVENVPSRTWRGVIHNTFSFLGL